MSKEFHITLLSNDSIDKYPNNVLSVFTNYLDTPIVFTSDWEVGITELFYNKFIPKNDHEVICDGNGEQKTCVHWKPDRIMDFFFIHTDIISTRRVGNQMVRCLKVLPADASRAEYVKFGRIEYYPIESSYIRSISIAILDVESQRINFADSSLPTFITLHFRQKSI